MEGEISKKYKDRIVNIMEYSILKKNKINAHKTMHLADNIFVVVVPNLTA
jgi:hypothetical protein